MKKTILLLFAFCAFGMMSCDKDSKVQLDNDAGPDEISTFELTVDGVVYQPVGTITQHNSGLVIIQGNEGPAANFGLTVPDTLVPGTYPMTSFAFPKLVMSFDSFQTSYTSTEGSMTIVSHDMTNHAISGTYNCTVIRPNPADTLIVTGGEFNVNY